MPRPCKPTELLELTSAFRPDRHAARGTAPKSPQPVGTPPLHRASNEAVAWTEFADAAPAGVLTEGNRWVLEMACGLMARSRRQGLSSAELGHLRALLAELGASPVSRGRMQGARPAEASAANPWDVPSPARN